MIKANPYYNPLLYFLGKHFTGLSFDLIWRRHVFGRENIPPPGRGTIFAANHRSLADPNLVGSAIPYPIHYFAKAELFNIPLLGWYIRRVNAFPVKRGEQDVSAFKTAHRILKHGEGLLLFPEGGRRRGDRQWVARPGVGMLACKTGARIVPVCVRHSEHFTRLAAIDVIFGKPFEPPREMTRETYQQVSDQVIQKIRALQDSVPERGGHPS